MSLADELEVRVAGNLCEPVTQITRGGSTCATSRIAASPIALVGGRMDSTPIRLLLEVHGVANAAGFAARAGVGSRVILRGRLEQRPVTRIAAWPRADGDGTVAVRVTVQELVVVVERLLSVSPPSSRVEEV
jgi:hypothetical protein